MEALGFDCWLVMRDSRVHIDEPMMQRVWFWLWTMPSGASQTCKSNGDESIVKMSCHGERGSNDTVTCLLLRNKAMLNTEWSKGLLPGKRSAVLVSR